MNSPCDAIPQSVTGLTDNHTILFGGISNRMSMNTFPTVMQSRHDQASKLRSLHHKSVQLHLYVS